MTGKNYTNGKWVPSSNSKTYKHYNLAGLTEVIGIWPKSTVEE